MPELPEVESVRRSLEPQLVGRIIEDVVVLFAGSVSGDVQSFRESLTGQRLSGIERFGKYLVFGFASGAGLVMHLRMTGQAVVKSATEPLDRHCRLRFVLDDERELRFHDVRKFGRVAFVPDRRDLSGCFALGPEPLTADFSVDALAAALKGKAAVKSVLLDQRKIAGLGNIYADESLFRAGIHPQRPASSLSAEEIERLHAAIEATLREAIEHGGTTFRNYVQGDGRAGGYRDHLRVYGRYGETCIRCGTALRRIRVVGRGTTYCPACQR